MAAGEAGEERRADTLEAQGREIEPCNKRVDHSDRVLI